MMKKVNDSLAGKVVLVTGAGRGIGAGIAEHMAAAGASAVVITDVVINDDDQLIERLNKDYEADISFYKLDVTDETSWSRVVKEVVSLYGSLDVVVNNAGVEIAELLENYSLEQYKKQMSVNSDGLFLGCREAVRAMKPGGISGSGGSVINLSSIAGLIGLPGFSVYGGSKGFVRLFTKHMAVECARLNYGIRVNSIHPGLIETDMGNQVCEHFVAMGFAADESEAMDMVKASTPLGQLGKVDDIAAAAVYLASDASGYVTGTELVVDGGWAAS
jgi:NAD(P)-dependent dehydrogenase (short-subunit alcohol dehydrogenase family)